MILKSIHCHANLDVFEMPLAELRYHLAEELFKTHLICGRMDINFSHFKNNCHHPCVIATEEKALPIIISFREIIIIHLHTVELAN